MCVCARGLLCLQPFSRLGRLQRTFTGMATVLALREERDAQPATTPAGGAPYKYAFCSPPIAGKGIRESWIVQWLAYHLYIMKGDAHFFLYNVGGLSEQGRKLLEPFVQANIVTITDVLDEAKYPSWYHGQVSEYTNLFVSPCFFSSKLSPLWRLLCTHARIHVWKEGCKPKRVGNVHFFAGGAGPCGYRMERLLSKQALASLHAYPSPLSPRDVCSRHDSWPVHL